jgi:hypothetical protein
MCLPAAPLMLASAAMTAGSQVASGIQGSRQGKYESAIAKQNAGMEVDAARESERMGRDEAKTFWRDASQTKGQQVASMAANGIDVGFGTAERVQQDTTQLSREDADRLYRGTKERTMGHVINAGNYVEAAKAAKAKGKSALIGGLVGGATSLVGAAAQFKGDREKLGLKGWTGSRTS